MFTEDEAYFVTQRCFQGRPLMPPTPEIVSTIGGLLAKVTHKYDGVQLHDAVFMSNHFLCAAAHNKCYVQPSVMWSKPGGGPSDAA